MTFKKLTYVLCVLCAVIFSSCGDGIKTYTFTNKSSYTVQITLSEPYKEDDSTEALYLKDPFPVYAKNTKTVYIHKNDVDFSWTTLYAGDNSKVYCEINGSSAVFINQ